MLKSCGIIRVHLALLRSGVANHVYLGFLVAVRLISCSDCMFRYDLQACTVFFSELLYVLED
jgi:hypothetical protein